MENQVKNTLAEAERLASELAGRPREELLAEFSQMIGTTPEQTESDFDWVDRLYLDYEYIGG